MARISNEKYGVASSQGEIPVLKKMGVQERNIVAFPRCNELLQRITIGDTICVSDVRAFAVGAYDLVNKMLYLSNNGIEFQTANERYLSFSTVKPLSVTTVQTLKNIAQREYEFTLWIQNSRLSNDVKVQLISRIRYEFLTDIVLIFHNNGIKKKGN